MRAISPEVSSFICDSLSSFLSSHACKHSAIGAIFSMIEE